MALRAIKHKSPRATVFRELVAVLQRDTTLRALGVRWKVGTSKDDKTPFAKSNVGIRLRKVPGQTPWYSPDATVTPLVVRVTLEIDGFDEDDVDDLWHAVEIALYPRGDGATAARLAIQQALRAAGAETGEVEFTQPAFDPDKNTGSDGRFVADGQMRIDVLTLLNP